MRRTACVTTGLKALASLRMEKGYRDYGHDIDNTDTVLEAGLGLRRRARQARRLHRPGRGAGAEGAGPLTRRLVQVRLLDPSR